MAPITLIKTLSILGKVVEGSTAIIRAHDGTGQALGYGQCDGYLNLSAGSLSLWSDLECEGELPETFTRKYITLMLLDSNQNLQANPNIELEVIYNDTNIIAAQNSFADGAISLLRGHMLPRSGRPFLLKGRELNTDINGMIDWTDYRLLVMFDDGEAELRDEVFAFDENGEIIYRIP